MAHIDQNWAYWEIRSRFLILDRWQYFASSSWWSFNVCCLNHVAISSQAREDRWLGASLEVHAPACSCIPVFLLGEWLFVLRPCTRTILAGILTTVTSLGYRAPRQLPWLWPDFHRPRSAWADQGSRTAGWRFRHFPVPLRRPMVEHNAFFNACFLITRPGSMADKDTRSNSRTWMDLSIWVQNARIGCASELEAKPFHKSGKHGELASALTRIGQKDLQRGNAGSFLRYWWFHATIPYRALLFLMWLFWIFLCNSSFLGFVVFVVVTSGRHATRNLFTFFFWMSRFWRTW